MNMSSQFALLDVKEGRRDLLEALAEGDRIPVCMLGHVVRAGNDDGVSIEFEVEVAHVERMDCTSTVVDNGGSFVAQFKHVADALDFKHRRSRLKLRAWGL